MTVLIYDSLNFALINCLLQFDGLVQEKHYSSALAMELRFSCTNPLICCGMLQSDNMGLNQNGGPFQ